MFLRAARRSFALLTSVALCSSLTGYAAAQSADRGAFSLVTYNVAGLPEGVSESHPSVNMALIGGLLGRYDIVLVQEDFAYPAALRSTLTLTHLTPIYDRNKRLDFGDGLSQFARLPFDGLVRESWQHCHGLIDSYFDCLTPKGFSFVRQTVADGVFVDVYNLHMDAGEARGDARARVLQVEQLVRAIRQRSADRAVIVAGDTNIPPAQRDLVERLEQEAGLADACDALRCPDPERIDRVFFRGSRELSLWAERWQVDAQFVDSNQRPLSDHLAVAVNFQWAVRPLSALRPQSAGGASERRTATVPRHPPT